MDPTAQFVIELASTRFFLRAVGEGKNTYLVSESHKHGRDIGYYLL